MEELCRRAESSSAAEHVVGLPGSIGSLEFHAHEIKQDHFRAFSTQNYLGFLASIAFLQVGTSEGGKQES